jgi:hypothetical protein
MRKSYACPRRGTLPFGVFLMCLLITLGTHAQLRETHITGVNISPQITNYLEFLPSGYSNPANANKKYPMIIYWKGLWDFGVNDVIQKGVPQKIESSVFPEVVTYNGVQYSYIVITPMYADNGAGPGDVDAAINYMIDHYRVDRNRIYLTGISKGSAMIYEYLNMGTAYAKKIAAVAPLAACDALSWGGAGNVVVVHSHVWGLHAMADNICTVQNTLSSVNNVNLQAPNQNLAIYTNAPPGDPNYPHDIFWLPYEPGFTTPESGGKNMYDWFIQFAQTNVLPVSLKDFNARLNSGKVKLEWTTSVENNSGSFSIERAGRDMKFSAIAKLNATGFSSAEKRYQFTDNSPLPEVSFYRLSQTDRDGNTQYFDVKRILNGRLLAPVIVAPNPVKSTITLFMNVDRSQKLAISIIDMHGRTLSNTQQFYQEGLQEVNLPADNLAPGSYVLKVSGSTVNAVEKITKQ